MQNLQSFFRNPFSDRDISRNKKQKFGEDCIVRMSENNPGGQFSQLITDSIAVQQALFGDITNIATLTAIREGRTQVVDGVIADFSHRNTLLNKFLGATEVDKTPVYQEIFPQGVQPFTNQLTKENVELRIKEMITAVTNNLAVCGGQPTLDSYTTIQQNYLKARGEQLSRKAQIAAGLVDADAKEAAWDDQMFENLLTFALLNRGNPDALKQYMDQSILVAPTDSNKDGKGQLVGKVTKNGAPAAGIKVHVVDGNINDETSDGDGNYKTQNLPAGETFDVEFWDEDNLRKTVQIKIQDAGDTKGDVEL